MTKVSEVKELSPSTIVRTVGVEIECMTNNHPPYDELRDETMSDVVSDGSIDGDGEGFEVNTKPLKGAEAEENIKAVATILNQYEAFTNASCGLHVHVDAREVNIHKHARLFRDGDTLKESESMIYMHRNVFDDTSTSAMIMQVIEAIETTRMLNAHGQFGDGQIIDDYTSRRMRAAASDGGYIIPDDKYSSYFSFAIDISKARSIRRKLFDATRFFSAIDPILRSLVPSSRRHNTYCQPLEKLTRIGGECPLTLKEVLNATTSRYCGINLQAIEKHGTLECRYHGGTTNADKIIHWTRMWERCVDMALSQYASEEADSLSEVVNGKNRLEMLCALLGLPEETSTYLMERHTAFMGSDARHAIAYINRKNKNKVCAV